MNMCRYTRVYRWKHHLAGYTTGATDDARMYCKPGFFYLNCAPTEKDLVKLGRRLVDMDIYQPGFDREWVKRFKAMLKAPRLMVGARLDWDGQV
jgi:hypothetical protein